MATAVESSFAWRVEAGERETLQIPILDDDNRAFPIPGWTVNAKIKDRPGGATLYTFPADTITVVGNVIILAIPATVSAAWTFTTGWYRVVISDPTSAIADPSTFRVQTGVFVVDAD